MTETTTQLEGLPVPEVAPLPEFKLDVPTIEVEADISTKPSVQKIIAARMSKPTKADLIKREEMSLTEIVEVNATEDEVVSEDERASAYLFDKIAKEVRGFRLAGEPAEAATSYREATPELLKLIPSNFKAAFVRGMYNVTAKFVEDEEVGFVLGGSDILSVDLIFGAEDSPNAVIHFDLPEPTESERRSYANDSVHVRTAKGSRKGRSRIVSNIGASVKFFDGLMERAGADITSDNFRVTVAGRTFAEASSPIARKQFIDAIDPTYKRHIALALMSHYSVKVQD